MRRMLLESLMRGYFTDGVVHSIGRFVGLADGFDYYMGPTGDEMRASINLGHFGCGKEDSDTLDGIFLDEL